MPEMSERGHFFARGGNCLWNVLGEGMGWSHLVVDVCQLQGKKEGLKTKTKEKNKML